LNKELTNLVINRYISGKGITELEDTLIVEKYFSVYINGSFYKTIFCISSYLDELLIGHLTLEGIITSNRDVKKFEVEAENINITISSCPVIYNELKAGPEIQCYGEDILYLMQQHLNSSRLHDLTGGVHVMSLASGKKMLITREDIGRHNAVDKVYGYCLKNNIDCSNKIFLSSGRITHELIQKLIGMGLRIVVSRATVSSLAREIAEQAGVTLIGFARGQRFNIYSHPQRILS